MLHRNAAQKRPGKKPSASQAFQQLPRAQIPANGDTPCQLSRRQPDATTAMEGSAGAKSTTCTSLIPGGPPSPSPRDLTTHGARPALQQAAPATTGEAPPERRAQHARYHSPETGHKHAGSNRLQLGGKSTPAATSARDTLPPTKPITQGKLRTLHRPGPARDLPFGAAHEQVKHVMDQLPANNIHKISDDRKMVQGCAQASEALQPSQDHGVNAPAGLKRLARNVPLYPLMMATSRPASTAYGCDANLCPMPLLATTCCS